MDTLQVGHGHGHSKGSSRSQSPAAEALVRDPAVVTDDALIRSRVQSPSTAHHVSETSSGSSSRHGERGLHHAKTHSRDLGSSPLGAATPASVGPTHNSTRDLEDSPQKKMLAGLMAQSEFPGAVYSPNVSYALSSADEYSPAYRSQDDYSNTDENDSPNVTSTRAQTAIAQLTSKIERTKDLIRLEQTIRDDNVNEYLKLAANADKQQLQRIKAVFEKKNQKSAHCIAQLQKKLEGYNKRIKNWEQHGNSGQAHRQPREMLRDVGQGLKNVGGNIRDGITGLGGSVMAAPREFAHLFSRSNRFGSADNITQLAANASSEGSRASEGGEAAAAGAPRGSTLPRAATSPGAKFTPEASPSSSVTSEGAPYPTQTGSNNMSEAAFTLKPILNELRERREDYERLAEKLDSFKNLSAEVSYLSGALQEERFKTERLEEQINDLTELHQNEVENLKQALTDVEEKVQYQSEERIRDIHEALDLCQTKISKLEQWMAGAGAGGGGLGAGGEPAAHALPPRLLLVKLLNVALTLLQLVLLLVATVAGIAMPFLRTRVRVLTTSVAVMVGVMVLNQWPEVTQLTANLARRLNDYLLSERRNVLTSLKQLTHKYRAAAAVGWLGGQPRMRREAAQGSVRTGNTVDITVLVTITFSCDAQDTRVLAQMV
ncbi:Transmembrane and coiled-coil domains protein 2 [Eumeta japonica]|uniref:Transmembrane and coiled-coil domains protein 2 n=1 Tax=Eumeta variegata TaxID=151549 RepID=A0A4C1UR04_EUMVA|nr:Transmembrane and coiled-coil domains protein 2 [Eumeta japonica]